MSDETWPEFLTVEEIAEIMRTSKMTVYRLIHNQELVAIRAGRSFRIPSDNFKTYLAGATTA